MSAPGWNPLVPGRSPGPADIRSAGCKHRAHSGTGPFALDGIELEDGAGVAAQHWRHATLTGWMPTVAARVLSGHEHRTERSG